MQVLSVKSTRYTLKELRNESEFKEFDFANAQRYIVLTGNRLVDNASICALEKLRIILNTEGMTQDIAKYALPECYKTELTWSINARALQNFLTLRTSKAALKEIRELAYNIYEALPDEHKFIFKGCLNEAN